jgi:hypothetical protein
LCALPRSVLPQSIRFGYFGWQLHISGSNSPPLLIGSLGLIAGFGLTRFAAWLFCQKGAVN